MNLSTLLIWVLTLQRMWLGLDIPYETMNVTAAREFVSHMGDVSVELGYVERNQWIPVTITDYKLRLPQYHQMVKAGLDPRGIYETLSAISSPPPNWRGGATRCGKREIIFNQAWLSPTWLFYESPLWMSVAAHERAHIVQGCDSYGIIEAEQVASIIGFHLLATSDRPESHLALIAGLREIAIAATVVYTNDIWLLESLGLSAGEREYFDSILAQCQVNRDYCEERSEKYWIGPLSQMELIREPGLDIFVIPDLSQDD